MKDTLRLEQTSQRWDTPFAACLDLGLGIPCNKAAGTLCLAVVGK